MTHPIDEFTRWLCAKCGEPGHDSWNKAMHDGINYAGDYPNPNIIGDECQRCGHPAVLAYTTADAAPHAIYGPDPQSYSYESEAMDVLAADPDAGSALQPSSIRDRDWRGGCLGAVLGLSIEGQSNG